MKVKCPLASPGKKPSGKLTAKLAGISPCSNPEIHRLIPAASYVSLPECFCGHTLQKVLLAWDVGAHKSIKKCPGFGGLTSFFFEFWLPCKHHLNKIQHQHQQHQHTHKKSTNTKPPTRFWDFLGAGVFVGDSLLWCLSSRKATGYQLNFEAHGLQVDTRSHALHANAGTPRLEWMSRPGGCLEDRQLWEYEELSCP